jgi:cytochrome c
MKSRIGVCMLLEALAMATLLIFSTSATALDDTAREALMKKSNCFKCHSVEKKKDGPPFKETAGKYKDKTDGQEKLYTHLTTNPKVKIDGKEETHDMLKTKDEADIKAVITWILSR